MQEQQQLLMHPETNPTRYVPFENASAFPFRPDASTVSRLDAWWLADAAWLAYWPDKDAALEVFRDGAGLTAQYAVEEGAEAYFASSPTFAIVTFRGTQPDDWSDIFDDACYATDPWDAGHVHRGFARRLQTLKAPLERFLRTLPPGCRVWFTGHSLGAAVATLAAYRYRDVTGGVCTFGSPLVGTAAFSERFDAVHGMHSVRYVNDRDIVTRVPPPRFALPHGEFTHVNHVRWIDKDGQVAATMPSAAPHALDLVKAFVLRRSPALPDGMADHTPLYYALHCWNDFARHFGEEN